MSAPAVALGVGVVVVAAALAGVALATYRTEPRTGRHGQRRGVRFGTPTQIRRHRRGGREHAWAGTRTVCARPAVTGHVLDEDDTGAVRRWSGRFEDTGEITSTDLDALLSPRPAAVPA